MKTKPVAEATFEEVRLFAQVSLGLDIDERVSKKETILAKAEKAGHRIEQVIIYDMPKQSDLAPKSVGRTRDINGEECVKINVAAVEGQGGDRPVPVTVNGRTMLIPRGDDVWVPVRYAEVLKNAVMDEYEQSTKGLGDPRKTYSYPFNYVG